MATKTKKPAGKKKSTVEPRLDRKALVKKAYEQVSEKLEKGENGKTIDDLVKLMKLEKDLGGEETKDVREIEVRWVPSDKESSKDQ